MTLKLNIAKIFASIAVLMAVAGEYTVIEIDQGGHNSQRYKLKMSAFYLQQHRSNTNKKGILKLSRLLAEYPGRRRISRILLI